MSKFYLWLFMICFSAPLAAQENVLLNVPNSDVVWTSYANMIQVSFLHQKNDSITLECADCDTIFPFNIDENQWLISVKEKKKNTIVIIARNQDGKEVGQREFLLKTPPLPLVFLDEINAHHILLSVPDRIELKIPRDIPVSIIYNVLHWSVQLGDKTYTGRGPLLSEEVKDQMRKLKSGFAVITIQYHNSVEAVETKDIFQFHFK